MSFLDDVDNLRRKSGFSPARSAVVVGLIIILVIVLVFAIQLVWGVFTTAGSIPDESNLLITSEDAANGNEQNQGDTQNQSGAPNQGDSQNQSGAHNAQGGEEVQGTTGSSASVYVHVAGAVAHPGLYSLQEGSRVQDAIDAAGGLSKDALGESVNLARVVSDGEQIIVASKADRGSTSNAASSGGSRKNASSGSSASGISMGKVNINQASAEELMTLQGVGEATATKIIAYREEHGSFARIEDIKKVSGIGDKKFATIKDAITV